LEMDKLGTVMARHGARTRSQSLALSVPGPEAG
jgi:hypothetical protein